MAFGEINCVKPLIGQPGRYTDKDVLADEVEKKEESVFFSDAGAWE